MVADRPTEYYIGTGAQGGGSAEELDEAGVAVRLVVLLLEGALVQLLQAESADKVLRVKLLEHGRDAAPRDRLLAAVRRSRKENRTKLGLSGRFTLARQARQFDLRVVLVRLVRVVSV